MLQNKKAVVLDAPARAAGGIAMSKIIHLDDPKPDHIPQDQWDRLKEAFDKIYDDESEE